MGKVHCFTSATFSYMDRVRTLGKTIREYHPEWEFSLCLCDEKPEGVDFDLAREPIDHIITISDLEIENEMSWIFQHNIVELCTAVKGSALCYLLERGAEKVVYLDPDIALFGRLDEVLTSLETNSIVLTPHQLQPEQTRRAIVDNEIGSLKYGIYNLGFVAVANSPEGRRFAAWWRDRLVDFCFDDVPNGLFTDQKWCDHVPSFFDDVHILKHPGYNVASWNISQRDISIDVTGRILVLGQPLKFFHFTKIDWVGEIMLETYCNDHIEVFDLVNWYKRQLADNAVAGLPRRYWVYNTFTDGNIVLQKHRDVVRRDRNMIKIVNNPFERSDLFLQD